MITYILLNYSCAVRSGLFSSICRAGELSVGFIVTLKKLKRTFKLKVNMMLFLDHIERKAAVISLHLKNEVVLHLHATSGDVHEAVTSCSLSFPLMLHASSFFSPPPLPKAEIHQYSPKHKLQTTSVSVTKLSQ